MRPHLLAAGDLADLLVAAERVVTAIARRDDPEGSEGLVVGLAALRDESIGFAFTSNREGVVGAAYQKLLAAVENRIFSSLPAQSLEGLRTLTRFAGERKGRTEFWNGVAAGPLLALESGFAEQLPAPHYVRGETVLYGKVERVGGLRPRVRLRVAPRELVYGDLTEEQAQEIGKLLYKKVALRGHATWDAQDGSVVYFRVEGVERYEPAGAREAFKELRAVTGNVFDEIEDVDLFAQRVREGESPWA